MSESELDFIFEARAGSPVNIRANEDGTRTVFGHAAVFGARAVLLPGLVETVARGAFGESIVRGDDVRLTVNHDPNQLLARTRSRTLTIREDNIGLYYEAPIDLRDPDAQRVVTKMQRGDLSGSSFRFMTPPDEQEWTVEPDGTELRTLKRLTLVDVTIGTYPVYDAATAALRTRPADLAAPVRVPLEIIRRHRLTRLHHDTHE